MHTVTMAHPFTVLIVAQEFMDNIYKPHGMPDSIILDRDKVFISHFWRDLFKKLGTKVHLSIAYHPKTDGQTKVVNKCLEGYLRCMTRERPQDWQKWLPLANWWYSTTFHSSIQVSPYEALYGKNPPIHLPYLAGTSLVATVDRNLQQREATKKLLQFHLKRSQD